MDLITPSSGLIFWQLSGLVYLGFWANALFDCLRNEFRGANQKFIWLILIGPVFGTFQYLSMSRSSKKERKFLPNFN